MQQEPSKPLTAIPHAQGRRISARIFYGFAIVIAIDTVFAGILNPDRGEIEFWIMLGIIWGGLFAWSAWIGYRLSHGKGVVAAYFFLGILSSMVLIGALIQFLGGIPQTTPFPGLKIMQTLRTLSAAYLLLAWIVVVWESVTNAKRLRSTIA